MRCFHQAFDSDFNRPPLAEIVHGSLVAPKIDRDKALTTVALGVNRHRIAMSALRPFFPQFQT